MPGSSRNVVAEAKDLKPLTVRLLRCTDLRGSAGLFCCRAGYLSWARTPGHGALKQSARLSPPAAENPRRETKKGGKKMRAATWCGGALFEVRLWCGMNARSALAGL
jgi:hypothetical protein